MSKKFVVTGCAGFIGSHLTIGFWPRATASSGSTRSRTTTRGPTRRRISQSALSSPRVQSVRGEHAGPDGRRQCDSMDASWAISRASSPTVIASTISRPRPGSVSAGADVRHVRAQQRIGDATAPRSMRRLRRSHQGRLSRRRRPSTGSKTELPAAGGHGCPGRARRTGSPSSPGSTSRPVHANHRLDTVSLRFFTVYGPRQRPDMAFNKFIRAISGGPRHRGLRRREPDPRLHLCGRHQSKG